jgi:hypothetical protein
MTTEHGDVGCPAEVLESIPWYPDGLGDAQRGALEAHAAECGDCRRELAFVQAEPVAELPPAPDAERVWARVLEKIAADAGDAARLPASLPAARRAPAVRRWLRAAARPLPLAASVALAVAVGTLGTLGGAWLAGPGIYRTASAPPEAGPGAGPALDVVFRSDASAGDIERALRAVGGSVVGGPSPIGRYRVALRSGSDAAGAADVLRSEAGGVASYAQPAPR